MTFDPDKAELPELLAELLHKHGLVRLRRDTDAPGDARLPSERKTFDEVLVGGSGREPVSVIRREFDPNESERRIDPLPARIVDMLRAVAKKALLSKPRAPESRPPG